MSADSRYVLYDSSASNLVTGQNDVPFDPGNPNDQFIATPSSTTRPPTAACW